ncbi:Mitochondrial porin [Lambiella insularis]|nr:Mitochondrial porin [Lambiella insularis]
MSIPAFSDIAKSSNDLLTKDFFHTAASNLDVKSKAPNGVSFNVKGKSTHEGQTGGSIEAKYKDDPSGTFLNNLSFLVRSPFDRSSNIGSRLTLTQAWTTANTLDTKIEVDNQLAKGLKAELVTHYVPKNNSYGAKTNLYFKQPNFHGRAFINLISGVTATIDAVMGHEGFLVGAEAGYDVEKAAITRYSAAVGYSVPQYTAGITATNNLSVFAASYYHKVNSDVEAGAKATWDSKAGDKVGLEVASKYRLDPSSFVKAKVNDRGIAALAYSVLLRPGFTLGLGASFDTQNLNEASHKVGASFTFDA